jgi:ABC-2 type transport system ATP-binding protein
MTPILVHGLRKSFGRSHVLRGLDLHVEAGSIYGLLGRNGAGKTTLIRVLMGLARPNAGSIAVMGCDPLTSSRREKQRVAYVAQGELIPPGASVAEVANLDAALRSKWNPASLEAWMRGAGIVPRRKVRELSGGERKRLELELALAAQPEVLLLDEPFIGLDPVARAEFMGQLMGFAADQEATILISSHVIGDLERMCDRVGILARGAIAHESTLEELKSGRGESLEEVAVKLMRKLEAEEVSP